MVAFEALSKPPAVGDALKLTPAWPESSPLGLNGEPAIAPASFFEANFAVAFDWACVNLLCVGCRLMSSFLGLKTTPLLFEPQQPILWVAAFPGAARAINVLWAQR